VPRQASNFKPRAPSGSGEPVFLKRIFGRGKPREPKVESLSLDSLRGRVDALKKERLAEVQPKLTAAFNKIASERESLLAGLRDLVAAELVEDVHPGLYKTVDEARRLLADKLTRALTSIRPPGGTAPADLLAFDEVMTRAVNLMTAAIVAHGRFVARLFTPQLRPVESHLRELYGSARDAHAAIEKVLAEVRSLEGVSSKIALHADLTGRVEGLRADIMSLEKRAAELEGFIEAESAQLAQLIGGEEFGRLESSRRELEQIEHELTHAEAVAAHIILDFSRPLRKMRKLVMSGKLRMTKENSEVLELCIENPPEVFSSGKKLGVATALLRSMLELIESGEISLDARERRKRIEYTRVLLSGGALAKLRGDIERLRDKKGALEGLCQRSPILEKQAELKRVIGGHTSDLERAKATLDELRRDLQKTEEEIRKNKAELEEVASGVIGASVVITS